MRWSLYLKAFCLQENCLNKLAKCFIVYYSKRPFQWHMALGKTLKGSRIILVQSLERLQGAWFHYLTDFVINKLRGMGIVLLLQTHVLTSHHRGLV